MNLPIKKLQVLINQSFTLFTNSLIELKKKQIGEKTSTLWCEVKYKKLLSQMRRSSFIFEENHVFIEEENLQS